MNNPFLLFLSCCIVPWLLSCAFCFYLGGMRAQGRHLRFQSPVTFRRFANKSEPGANRQRVLDEVKATQK